MGLVRDEVDDEEWITKLNNDENKLKELHDKIQSPIVFMNYFNMVLALTIVLVMNLA